MAQTSPMKRKLRRLKRERSQAYRLADLLVRQRDQARAIAHALAQRVEAATVSTAAPSPIIQQP